jgi:hypothetical protein
MDTHLRNGPFRAVLTHDVAHVLGLGDPDIEAGVGMGGGGRTGGRGGVVEGEEVVQEEDLSDEEADSAGLRSSEVGGASATASVGGTGARQGRVERRDEEFESERV